VRALADSAILRIPREALRRVVSRWQGSTSSGRRIEVIHPPMASRTGGRLAALFPISEGIPCVAIADELAQVIVRETRGRVLRLQVDEMHVGRTWSPTPVSGEGGVFLQRVQDGKDPQRLGQWLDRGRAEFPYVVVEVARNAGIEAFRQILLRSWAIYPMLRQNGESLFELNLLVKEAEAEGFGATAIKPLVHLEHSENAHGLSRYISGMIRRPVHMYLREAGPSDVSGMTPSLRRLGREICDRQVGLALSSGAARGLSHIGVIQVLEENGIEVDVVAGSSMGAYIAAVWSVGYGGREMEKFARELESYRGLWGLLDMAIYPRKGFLLTKRVRQRLERTIGESHFSDMSRPIRLVATRLDTLERTIFSGGSLVDAVLASIAIPGICVPVTIDGVSYIDGGICDPLPVDVLVEMGIRKIIAVNTIATPEILHACKMEVEERMRNGGLLGKANRLLNPFAMGNVFDTMMRSIHAAQTRLAEASCMRANVVLRPYCCQGKWHDFGNPSRYIPLGREEAEARLPAIRALIESPTHEHEPPIRMLEQAA
jgi:NTE family protein